MTLIERERCRGAGENAFFCCVRTKASLHFGEQRPTDAFAHVIGGDVVQKNFAPRGHCADASRRAVDVCNQKLGLWRVNPSSHLLGRFIFGPSINELRVVPMIVRTKLDD